MKLTNKSYYLLFILFFFGLSIKLYFDKNEISNRYDRNIKAQNDTIKYYKNKFNNEVASKLAIELTLSEFKTTVKGQSKEIQRLKEAVKRFKKPIATIQSKQEITFKPTQIEFVEPINCDFKRDINFFDKYYQLNAKVSNIGFNIDSLKLFNNQDIVIGYKKQGLFKKPLLTAEITNTNPYIKQVEIKPIVIKYNEPIYKKWYITIPTGIIIGSLLK